MILRMTSYHTSNQACYYKVERYLNYVKKNLSFFFFFFFLPLISRIKFLKKHSGYMLWVIIHFNDSPEALEHFFFFFFRNSTLLKCYNGNSPLYIWYQCIRMYDTTVYDTYVSDICKSQMYSKQTYVIWKYWSNQFFLCFDLLSLPCYL